jgi:phosphopantothenoylcysteine decarboxylase/phosphopantothenate--cysteine ligase
MKTLESYGVRVLDAPGGELASGLTGRGRMSEPDDIVREIVDFFLKKKTISH